MRVNDEPNVMACRARARGGEVLRSQNAFPNASLDVFAVADWFFPKGMDHHHLMVGAGRALNETMQFVARKMSGLGTLPESPRSFASVRSLRADALIIGAGASGVAAANLLSRDGFSVILVDLNPAAGGSSLDDPTTNDLGLALDEGATALFNTAAAACFDGLTLLEDREGIVEVHSSARVFASGTHDVLGAFAGNDLPGVFSARAFCRALCHGVLLGERVVVAGEGFWSDRVRRAVGALSSVKLRSTDGAVSAVGSRRVERAVIDGEELRCDALAVEGSAASSYELAGQAGASLGWSPSRGCFEATANESGETSAPGVFVCGSQRLGEVSFELRAADGELVGRRVARYLREQVAR